MPKPDALTLQLLAWIAARPRTYAGTMAAWRSSCPRLTIWEDACDAGFVQIERGRTLDESAVVLTALGKGILNGQAD
jgi:hypothetical protein